MFFCEQKNQKTFQLNVFCFFCSQKKILFIITAMKNDRWYESWFCAPPPANPARDTNNRYPDAAPIVSSNACA
jgi:hypothetical protein